MKKIKNYLGLLLVGVFFSCAGVGGDTLTEEEQEIAIRALLEQTSFASTYVNSALNGAEERAVIENKTDIKLDENGSTLDYKASVTCGANMTVSVTMKASFEDMKGNFDLEIEGNQVNCTSYLSGDMNLEFSTKVGLSGSEVKFWFGNRNSKGLTLKIVDSNSKEIIFEKPVFFLFDTSYNQNNLGSVSANVTCKINSQKFESNWIENWSFDF